MKKLGKLQINPEKLMKNEELLILKGGYDGGNCWTCWVSCPPPGDGFHGPCCGPSWTYAYETCKQMWEPAGCFCTIST